MTLIPAAGSGTVSRCLPEHFSHADASQPDDELVGRAKVNLIHTGTAKQCM